MRLEIGGRGGDLLIALWRADRIRICCQKVAFFAFGDRGGGCGHWKAKSLTLDLTLPYPLTRFIHHAPFAPILEAGQDRKAEFPAPNYRPSALSRHQDTLSCKPA